MKSAFIVLLFLIVLDWTIFSVANAHSSHHHGEVAVNGVDGQDGQDGVDGVAGISYNIVDDDTMDSIMATSMALSAVEFSHGTRKTQVGIGLGHYSGKNAISFGVAKLIETQDSEFLAVGKIGWVEDENEAAVGVGATWLIGD